MIEAVCGKGHWTGICLRVTRFRPDKLENLTILFRERHTIERKKEIVSKVL